MSLERPQPPQKKSEVELLREEVKKLHEDISFLKRLLHHVHEEFSELKQKGGR